MIEKARSLLVIQPLPDDFWQRLSAYSHGHTERSTTGHDAAVAYIRHKLTNYDALLRIVALTPGEIDQLRSEINSRANQMLLERIRHDAHY